MSTWHLISNIDIFSTKEQLIKLIKKRKIDFIDIFPPVIENIIYSYTHDIIEITTNTAWYNDSHNVNIEIKDQNICNEVISFKLCLRITIDCCAFYNLITKDNQIITPLIGTDNINSIRTINDYMKFIYNKHNYIDKLVPLYPHIGCAEREYFSAYKNSTIIGTNYSRTYGVRIVDHLQFKNICVIIKCIVDKIQKIIKNTPDVAEKMKKVIIID